MLFLYGELLVLLLVSFGLGAAAAAVALRAVVKPLPPELAGSVVTKKSVPEPDAGSGTP